VRKTTEFMTSSECDDDCDDDSVDDENVFSINHYSSMMHSVVPILLLVYLVLHHYKYSQPVKTIVTFRESLFNKHY